MIRANHPDRGWIASSFDDPPGHISNQRARPVGSADARCDVLVVEDHPVLRRSIVQMLQHGGLRAVAASDGADALAALEKNAPWLIILDIRLPVMSGPEFLQELRHRGNRSKVLVITASRDAAEWARQLQAVAYVGKPFDMEELLAAVEHERPRDRGPSM
jgi:DNA-binding response OmpR family regulator